VSSGLSWELREIRLSQPFRTAYDRGEVDDWMESYIESAPIEDFSFVGAYVDGAPCGLLTWKESLWNSTLWLVDIRVQQDRRRQGIGSALMQWLQNTARERGVRGIALETQASNVPAIRFYQSHGFRIAGFHDRLYTNDTFSADSLAIFLFWETSPTDS
jgi:ribosomal protein S18 acetylase RimI-like enzyme